MKHDRIEARGPFFAAWVPAAVLCALLLAPGQAAAQANAPDTAAIRAVALDYIEGWYTGDADRMARALHPQLVKRILMDKDDGSDTLEEMTADELTAITAGGGGRNTPAEHQRTDVRQQVVLRHPPRVPEGAGESVD
jgi:hypothetical protein